MTAIENTFEYKYQIAMETAEQNTSKQASTKKTALRCYAVQIFQQIKWHSAP